MSSKPRDKLEKLAGQRADQSRKLVEQETQQLLTIDQQNAQLHTINREYQQGTVGRDDIAPQLLAQRRAFVEQLTAKLDALKLQREQKRQSLHTSMQKHQLHTAQHSAIELMNHKRVQKLEIASNRQEMHQLEDAARGQYFQRQRFNKELGND